jgi:taurine dioxygenase
MELRALAAGFGVEAVGVDLLGAASPAADIDSLREAFDRSHLLLLRGEPLQGEVQTAFAARFGTLVPEGRLWNHVSNVRPDGIVPEGALLFHSDLAFTPSPVHAICLHALEVPSDGAPTRFADAVGAAKRLPSGLQQRLEGRSVLNVFDFLLPNDRPMRLAEVDARSPRCEHPVIGTHPRTGAPVVMASEMHTDHIVGLPPSESASLLADLFAVLYDDDNLYEHRWSVGDLVLWDNLALQHGRRDIPIDEPRTLQRVTLGPHSPRELVPNLGELVAGESCGAGTDVDDGSQAAS